MTRDELTELIREVLSEQEAALNGKHDCHRRAPLVRFSDQNGKPWYSATISRVQAMSAVLVLLSTIFAGIWASMAARDQLVVYPNVNKIVDARMIAHEIQVRRDMDAIRPQIATKTELDEVDKKIEVSRAEREKQYEAIQAQLDRIERRLERLGR